MFPRCGAVREPHFAHYSGNSSRECEHYHPGDGTPVATTARVGTTDPVGSHGRRVLGAPAIIWRRDAQLPASLLLRLPFAPDGFSSNIRIVSLASSQFHGSDLVRPVFARLRLKSPPGECETSPRNDGLERLISDTLSTFKLSGNFFRATIDGGVLEPPSLPLELGEEYWLITQTPLREPSPDLLRIVERRTDRMWFAYLIELQNVTGDCTDVLRDIKAYLQREVVRRQPRIHLVWPMPDRFDLDGVPVFDASVRTILVRSTEGVPQYFSTDGDPISSERVCESLYAFVFDGKQNEVFAGVPHGVLRRLRFTTCHLSKPDGVTIRLNETTVQAFEPNASDLIGSPGEIHLRAPAHRVWRNITINGALIRPIPDGADHTVKGPIQVFDAGAFGRAQVLHATGGPPTPWHSPLANLVAQVVGPYAAQRLEHAHTKAQLLRWAQQHAAHAVLPKLLSAISSEVDRGLP